jgi:hypothetical protein
MVDFIPDPYQTTRGEIYVYEGETNHRRKPHGMGTMILENGDKFTGRFRDEIRDGPGTMELSLSGKSPIQYIDGVYTNDRLEGRGKIEYRNGDILYAW